MAHQVLQPKGWPRPPGYANGVVAQGRMVVLAGQIGWDAEGRFAEGLSAQIGQALANIVTLL
ncbi:MAG TPA: RidA family protein, partial [Acetobacteraceae bacterium]